MRDMTIDIELAFSAEDGWPIRGLLTSPGSSDRTTAAAVLVPGSLHERDAWTSTAVALSQVGIASLRIDVRGRGASKAGVAHASMPPGQRRRVWLDVCAAIDVLRQEVHASTDRIAIVGEQDTAPACAAAAATAGEVSGLVMLSPRGASRFCDDIARSGAPMLGVVSVEDRESVRATVDAYLAATATASELRVVRGLGFGITMAAVQSFEHPDAEPIEAVIANWLVRVVGT